MKCFLLTCIPGLNTVHDSRLPSDRGPPSFLISVVPDPDRSPWNEIIIKLRQAIPIFNIYLIGLSVFRVIRVKP